MSAYLALAVSVGVLAVLDTWLYFGPGASTAIAGLVWVSFIAWGCFFQSGAGTKGLMTAILGMTFGALVGVAAVLLASGPLAGLGDPWAISVTVGLGAFVICLASKIPQLSVIPASVYGFAAVAGPIALGVKGATEALLPVVISIVIGAVFGFVSELLANALTKKA
ncbi:DUF1097 domain-containing protein [Alteraurantiacibacter palmitatis]|uniref:DUF1097 domain-containing protein n=1 Tax=Alteraurantiacibacter palmitatis TaxID=2054628 RepID=A0ABV7E377_9SPHN